MKYFISSDIHSYYDKYKKALDNRGFDINNENHVVVILGDLFDRGEQHKELIDFLLRLPESRTLLIIGNHEDLMDELIERGYYLDYDVSNGTYATLMELCGINYRSFTTKQVKEILTSVGYYNIRSRMKDYYEINNNIFVHGWIPCDTSGIYPCCKPDWRNSSKEEWKESRWLNGMEMWKYGAIEPNKTIYCGHFHCSYGWSHIRQERKEFPNRNEKYFAKSFEPFIDKGICAVDACTAYSGIVNVVEVEDEEKSLNY